MTIQTINIGNVVNDGLGDDLRTAFEKVVNSVLLAMIYLLVHSDDSNRCYYF